MRVRLASLAALLLLAGCTSGGTVGSTGTVILSSASAASRPSSAAVTTLGSPTPVTPDGLTTGPGVTTTTIRLGLLVDADEDRGFSAGARLWMRAVNADGGVCGRSIALVSASGVAGYRDHAPGLLGFLAQPAASDVGSLDTLVAADEVPVLAASGSSSGLSATGLVPLGATDDVAAANGLSYLLSSGRMVAHATVGVITDESAAATNALAGARWWAARNDVTLVVRSGGSADTGLDGAAALLVLAGPTVVDRALSTTSVPVLTTVDGYDPSTVPAADAARLLVLLATPAFGSDQPAAAAVSEAAYAAGLTNPGPRLLAGYAVGTTWGRLLQRACADLALTRAGIATAMTTVGPAAVDSLLGPSDPGLVVTSQLPATRQSSVAQAAPTAPGGLKPLVWMVAAPGIEDYAPR